MLEVERAADLKQYEAKEIGVSDWYTVTQEQIAHFTPHNATATDWPSFIHHPSGGAGSFDHYGLWTPGEGVKVARRTVAKYREALRIPSSVQRRRDKLAFGDGKERRGAGAA